MPSHVVTRPTGVQPQAEQHHDDHDHARRTAEADNQPRRLLVWTTSNQSRPTITIASPMVAPDISRVGRHAMPPKRIQAAIGRAKLKAMTSSARATPRAGPHSRAALVRPGTAARSRSSRRCTSPRTSPGSGGRTARFGCPDRASKWQSGPCQPPFSSGCRVLRPPRGCDIPDRPPFPQGPTDPHRPGPLDPDRLGRCRGQLGERGSRRERCLPLGPGSARQVRTT